jgi:hypothetical protein
LVSLLLLTTLGGGGCLSCEQFYMFGGTKNCCSADGHCKTKRPPAKRAAGRECNQIAFDHQKSIDHHIELPMTAAVEIERPLCAVKAVKHWHGANAVDPSPPDLQILHSTFLI